MGSVVNTAPANRDLAHRLRMRPPFTRCGWAPRLAVWSARACVGAHYARYEEVARTCYPVQRQAPPRSGRPMLADASGETDLDLEEIRSVWPVD